MSDSKGAPRRPHKSKTIDLEASEVKRAEAEAAQAGLQADIATNGDHGETPRADDRGGETGAAATGKTGAQEAAPIDAADDTGPHAAAGDMSEPPVITPAKPQKSGAGAISLVASAVVGGLVALAGYGALNAAGIVGPGTNITPVADLGSMESEIAALREKVAALEATPAPAGSTDPRIDTLETRVGAVEAEAASLRETLAAASPGGQAGDSALAARVETLESRLAEAPAAAGGTESPVIAQLSGKVDAGLEGVNAAIASTGEKIAAVESRVGALEQTVANVREEVAAEADSGKDAARLIAANALKTAAAEGRPFADVMAPVEALAGAGPQIEILKTQAASGLARPADLLASFEPAASAILALDAPKPKGMLDGLLANARSLVKVEPAGPLEGNTNEAIVSRIRAALQAGDLATALKQWESLPEAARAVSSEWGGKLKVRVEAGAALDSVLDALGQG